MFYKDLPKGYLIKLHFVTNSITRICIYNTIEDICVLKSGYKGLSPNLLTQPVQTLHRNLVFSNTADEIQSSIDKFTNSISEYRIK